MNIVPDPALILQPFDLGVRVFDDEVHAPPEVHAFLNRCGIFDAGLLLPMFDDTPSLFLHGLSLAPEHVPALRAALDREVGHLAWPEREPRPVFKFGAMIPPPKQD